MIGRKIFITVSYQYILTFLNIIAFIFLARYLGPENVGILAIAMTLSTTAIAFTDFGLTPAHQKLLASRNDHSELNGFFFLSKLLLISLVLGSTFIYFTYFNKGWFTNTTMLSVFKIIIIYTFFGQIVQMIKASFGGLTKVAIQHTPTFISEVLNSITRIVLSLFGFSIVFVASSHLFFSFLTLIIMIFYVRKIPVKIPNLQYYKIYFKLALPMSLITIIYTLNSTVDKLILYQYFGEVDLAIYSSGFRFAHILSLIGMLVSGVTFPYFSKYYSNNNVERLAELSFKIEKYLTLLISPIILFSICFADYLILGLLGSEFQDSAEILALFCVGIYFFIIFHPLHILLGAMEKYLIMTLIQIIFLATNIFLCHYFSLETFYNIEGLNLGPYGIAISMISIYIFSLIVYKLISSYYLGDWRIETLVIQSLFFLLIYIFIVKDNVLADTHLITRLSYLSFMIIINYIFHYFFGYLESGDIKVILNITNPREFIKYIRSELLSEGKNGF